MHPADVPVHAIFGVLVVRAFAIDFGGTIARLLGIVAVLPALVAIHVVGESVDVTDMSEWLLLIALVPLIALLAERRESTTRQFAALYRDATDRLVTGQEELRHEVAQDLHDGVGQGLGALMLTLDLLGQRLAGDRESSALVERSRRLAETVLGEVEGVAVRLHPAIVHENGLAGAIGELAELAAIPVELSIDPDANIDRLSSPSQRVLFRIVQEALSNAARHSGASTAFVDIECTGDALRATITDDGVGFAPDAVRGRGLGLLGMEERAVRAGGRLEVASRPGRGTVVKLELPWTEDSATTEARPDGFRATGQGEVAKRRTERQRPSIAAGGARS